jgi:hypothetical protein
MASLKALVESAPGQREGVLPAPISKDKGGRYQLADYRVVSSGGKDEVRLNSTQLVDLGPSINGAVSKMMNKEKDRALAIELLARRVLSPDGPFVKDQDDAVQLLSSFLVWLEDSLDDAGSGAERRALERLCREIQEEIEERAEDLDNPFLSTALPEVE